MADWSALPDGVVVLITRLIDVFDDFVAFRATCASWRASTSVKDFDKWRNGLPLLMFNRMKDRDVEEREFFSLYKKKIIRISLPEAKQKSILASKGWLMMIGSSCDMCLLNPITGVEIQLPKITEEFVYLVDRFVLSASPSETSEYVVMVIYTNAKRLYIGFGFWKLGDPTWTKGTQPINSDRFLDLSYHDGKFYALSSDRKIWIFDVSETAMRINAITKIIDVPNGLSYDDHAFLVVCGGRLLLLLCSYMKPGDPCIKCIRMIELDVVTSRTRRIWSLGNNAIFLGKFEGFSVDAMRFPGVIEPNCIYLGYGVFNFAKGLYGMFLSYSNNDNSRGNVWVAPSF